LEEDGLCFAGGRVESRVFAEFRAAGGPPLLPFRGGQGTVADELFLEPRGGGSGLPGLKDRFDDGKGALPGEPGKSDRIEHAHGGQVRLGQDFEAVDSETDFQFVTRLAFEVDDEAVGQGVEFPNDAVPPAAVVTRLARDELK